MNQDPVEHDGPPGVAPSTGLPAVDDAFARLPDLDEQPVSEHHDALAAAHEALHESLQSPDGRPSPE